MVNAKLIRQYLFKLLMLIKNIISNVSTLKHTPKFVPIAQFLLSSYYYYYCGLSPSTVVLDDQTRMHFWISNHRRHDRPNLVLIHGCGGNALWQFFPQIKSLSKSFNVYIPDLLFFGKSHTKCTDRAPRYQAKCVMEGLKRGFGVRKCTVYSISYGGWVGYSMAEMYPSNVEMNVIVSSGIGTTIDQKLELLSQVGKQAEDVVVPKDPDALRLLTEGSLYKYNPTRWAPDFLLWEFIKMDDNNRKEQEELVKYLMSGEADSKVHALSQETLLVWGDEDRLFPKDIGHQLQGMLGPKARLMIIKGAGHAVNIDSPTELNELIKSFILGQSHK